LGYLAERNLYVLTGGGRASQATDGSHEGESYLVNYNHMKKQRRFDSEGIVRASVVGIRMMVMYSPGSPP
jgi:hypothetical protein